MDVIVIGYPINLGAEFVGPRHVHLKALVHALGLTLIPTKLMGFRNIWIDDDKRQSGLFPQLSFSEGRQILQIYFNISKQARTISPTEPWNSPRAAEYDKVSLGEWISSQAVSDRVYQLIDAGIGGFFTCPISELSYLFLLWRCSRGGGPIRALKNGSAMWIQEGSQEVSLSLQKLLQNPISLNSPVSSITQNEDHLIHVSTLSHTTFRARRAIVAVPLPQIKKLAFSPGLDPPFQALVENLQYGKASKVHSLYEFIPESFPSLAVGGTEVPNSWRRDCSLIGLACAGDSSPQDSAPLKEPSLSFGMKGKNPCYTVVQNWVKEAHIGGSYLIFNPGQLTRFGPIRQKSHGHVYFAGSDWSTWPDNMEGAVESGMSVAQRVLKTL